MCELTTSVAQKVSFMHWFLIILAVLCLDKNGHLAAGISTSGPPFKPPGRVGDSPLPGCGLYADDKAHTLCVTEACLLHSISCI